MSSRCCAHDDSMTTQQCEGGVVIVTNNKRDIDGAGDRGVTTNSFVMGSSGRYAHDITHCSRRVIMEITMTLEIVMQRTM
jgi:hypothetical protein